MKLKWSRSEPTTGHVTESTGRFEIYGQPEGTTRNVSFETTDAKTGERWTADTQRQAKCDAQGIVDEEVRVALREKVMAEVRMRRNNPLGGGK